MAFRRAFGPIGFLLGSAVGSGATYQHYTTELRLKDVQLMRSYERMEELEARKLEMEQAAIQKDTNYGKETVILTFLAVQMSWLVSMAMLRSN